MTLQIVQFLEDNIEELAHSPLMVETSSKTGKGLEKGLNPTLDLLVDKYFTLPESDDPDEDIIRFRESNTARHVLLLINGIWKPSIIITADLRVNQNLSTCSGSTSQTNMGKHPLISSQKCLGITLLHLVYQRTQCSLQNLAKLFGMLLNRG